MLNHHYQNIAVIGSGGAIGSAFVRHLATLQSGATINAFSSLGRQTTLNQNNQLQHNNVIYYGINYNDEDAIANAASIASDKAPLDLVVIATGMLHNHDLMPEKSLRDLSSEKFEHLFRANAITPALIAKHFLPKLNKNKRAVFAALSARVGSISDNRVGGWYSYRMSKAALNMMIKNTAIEMGRRYKEAIIVGLHPGTVDSELSKPFQSQVKAGKLFTPDYSAKKLLEVIDGLNVTDSGKCFAWDGLEIQP